MGCRCHERAEALRRVVTAGARADLQSVKRETAFIGRTLREDLRSGALARSAQQRLSLFRGRK